MKKIFAIIIAVAMMATMFSVSAFAFEQADQQGNFNNATGSALCLSNSDVGTIGSLFSTVTTAKGFYFGCPSWSENLGTLTLTLFAWDKDYETTVKSTPIAHQTFDDYEDNAYLGFEFETPVAAGLYYMEISDAADPQGSGVGVWTGGGYPGQAVFIDGEYTKNYSLRMYVDYTEEVETMYGSMPTFRANNAIGVDSPLPYSTYIIMKEYAEDFASASGNGIEASVNEAGNLVLSVGASMDPYYSMDFMQIGLEDEIACADYPVIAIRLRLLGELTCGGTSEAFMYTTTIAGAAGGYSTSSEIKNTTEWQTLVFDPSSNATFKKNALDGDGWFGFRFDVVSETPSAPFDVEIESISFFGTFEAASAFDGDFSALPTPEPTATPTPTPEVTATPEPTATPEATKAPDTTKAPDNTAAPAKSGCGSIMGGAALLVVLAAGVVLTKKKH